MSGGLRLDHCLILLFGVVELVFEPDGVLSGVTEFEQSTILHHRVRMQVNQGILEGQLLPLHFVQFVLSTGEVCFDGVSLHLGLRDELGVFLLDLRKCLPSLQNIPSSTVEDDLAHLLNLSLLPLNGLT